MAYHNQRELARATVCQLQKNGNRDGIGIYVSLSFTLHRFSRGLEQSSSIVQTPTPIWSNGHDQLYFEVVFIFPAPQNESSPLRIKEFTTQTSNFAHDINEFWQSMVFENIEVQASNSPIRANVSGIVYY